MKSSEKAPLTKSGSGQETQLDNFDDNFSEGKISPLAIPLEKASSPPEEPFPGERRQQGSGGAKRISQKEFLDKVFTRIDERIKEALNKRAAFPGTITILLILLASPFVINAGNDLYKVAKAQLIAPEQVKPAAGNENGTRALFKQNQALVEKLAKQNLILSKKITALIAVQEKIAKKEPNKIVLFPSSAPTVFSMKREKKILYEISGMDIDDPITEKSINKIKSVEILLAMVESFNRMLINSDNSSVSDFHRKNVVKAKRLVIKKLRQIK